MFLQVLRTAALVAVGLAGRPTLAEEIRLRPLETRGQACAEDAVARLLDAAAILGVESYLGPRSGSDADEIIERRLVLLARAGAERLVTLNYVREPYKDPIFHWRAEAEAVVSRSGLEEMHRCVKLMMDGPQPRIILAIQERIEYTNPAWGPAPFREDEIGSLLEQQIRNQLLDLGFEVLNKEQFEFIKDRNIDLADPGSMDRKRAIAMAADQGADILIVGRADVTGPRETMIGSQKHYYWETIPKVDVFWVNNARSIAAPLAPRATQQGATNIDGPAGARQALDNVGKHLGGAIATVLLKRVSAADSTRSITIRVRGIAASDVLALRNFLAECDGLRAQAPRFIQGVLEIRAMTGLDTFALASKIEPFKPPSGGRLGIEETGLDVIEFKMNP